MKRALLLTCLLVLCVGALASNAVQVRKLLQVDCCGGGSSSYAEAFAQAYASGGCSAVADAAAKAIALGGDAAASASAAAKAGPCWSCCIYPIVCGSATAVAKAGATSFGGSATASADAKAVSICD